MLDSIPNNLIGQFLKIFPENARPFLRSIRLALLVLPAGGLEVPIRRLREAIFILPNGGFVPTLFSDGMDVAQALHDPSRDAIEFFQGSLPPGDSAHMLIGYQDFDGNTHIADLALANITTAPQSDTASLVVHVSDMAILVGVSLTALDPHVPFF